MKHGAIAAFFVLILTANSFAQSVADVARKERQRQQALKSKVVVQGVGGAGATTVQGSSPSTAKAENTSGSAAPKQVTVTDNKGRDEQFWRTAFQNAREDLKRAEQKVQILDLRLKQLNTQLLQQTDIYNRENRLGAETTAAQQAMENAQKELDQARKRIADLEEELRRSGGPPGWAR